MTCVTMVLVRRLLALTAALMLLGAADAAARPVVVGIGDQKAEMFSDPRLPWLRIRHARLVIPWSHGSAGTDADRAYVERWLAGARRAGVEPLIGFGHPFSGPLRDELPTVAEYRRSTRRFMRRYPFVRSYIAWNEANHCSQPTCKRPGRAAAYHDVLRRACPRCTVVAGDVLDQSRMAEWVRAYRRALRTKVQVWGLHNYLDANRFRTGGTRRLLRAVRGRVWLTEVGGLIARRSANGRLQQGRIKLDESPAHAARVTRFVLDELVSLSPRLSRVYLYHWNARTRLDTWDSAFITPGGRERPAYRVLERFLERRRRR